MKHQLIITETHWYWLRCNFFSFIAGILRSYLTIFQTDNPMVPFIRDELEMILNQLLQLIFWKDALDKADILLKRLNKKWLTKMKHHLEDGLVDLVAATKDLLEKAQISAERKRKLCKQLVLDLVLKFLRKSTLIFVLSEMLHAWFQ